MALFYDVTKAVSSQQLSGLIRVSEKLGQALKKKLGNEFVPVEWHPRKQCFHMAGTRNQISLSAEHHFLTPEVFSSGDRPGLFEQLRASDVKSAAVFHDAIPYRFPDITWPKSVKRHPQYMRDLAGLNRVFSVSRASQDDLTAYWQDQGIERTSQLAILSLGADFFDRTKILWEHQPNEIPVILSVGILEPRKNQSELLEVACGLWDEGHNFELHFVGRINPHFGKPIEKQIKRARKNGYAVFLTTKQRDDHLLDLYAKTHFTVFNSITEGMGLPVVESLWLGIPCISKRLPSLSEFVDNESCVGVDSSEDLKNAIQHWLKDACSLAAATRSAHVREMPTWSRTIRPIVEWKEGP